METCGMTCIKYLLFVFNFVFAVSGIGIIVAGALTLHDVSEVKHFVDSDTLAPPIILIVAGVIVFIIAFLGCCGAIKESYNMLIAFAVLLLIIFIVELAVGIAAAVNKDTFKDHLRTGMESSLSAYESNGFERKGWHELQSRLECCGLDGPGDWKFGGRIPASCCKENESDNVDALCNSTTNPAIVYQDGCFKKLSMKIRDGAVIMMGVGIGIAFIELAGIILACFLASAIKRENSQGKD